jgi:hypothetical protein
MLRIIYNRPFLFNTLIRKTRQLTVSYRPLSAETLPVHHEIEEDNHRLEISAPHYELLEVLGHRSSQLQSYIKSPRSSRTSSPSSKRFLRYRSNNSRKNVNIESNPIKQEQPIELAPPKPIKKYN